MGLYVNPTRTTKISWLQENGQAGEKNFDVGQYDAVRAAGKVPVVLVSNGAFLALAVAYSKSEVEAFQFPDDRRPRQWWIVPVSALKNPDSGIDSHELEAFFPEVRTAAE